VFFASKLNQWLITKWDSGEYKNTPTDGGKLMINHYYFEVSVGRLELPTNGLKGITME